MWLRVGLRVRTTVGSSSSACVRALSSSMSVPGPDAKARRRVRPKMPPAKFETLAQSFLDRVEGALASLHAPTNEDFELQRADSSSMLIRTNGREFSLVAITATQRIRLESPISGERVYAWNAMTSRWEDEVDAHDVEGLLTRDLMRICVGVPAF